MDVRRKRETQINQFGSPWAAQRDVSINEGSTGRRCRRLIAHSAIV